MKPEQPTSWGESPEKREQERRETVGPSSKWHFMDKKGNEDFSMGAAAGFEDRLVNALRNPSYHRAINPNHSAPNPPENYLWKDLRDPALDKAFEEAAFVSKGLRKLDSGYTDLTKRFEDKDGKTLYFLAVRFGKDGKDIMTESGDSEKAEEEWNKRYEA